MVGVAFSTTSVTHAFDFPSSGFDGSSYKSYPITQKLYVPAFSEFSFAAGAELFTITLTDDP